MVPENPEVRWHAATSAFEEDDSPPEWSPPVSEVLSFIVAEVFVLLALTWIATVLG